MSYEPSQASRHPAPSRSIQGFLPICLPPKQRADHPVINHLRALGVIHLWEHFSPRSIPALQDTLDLRFQGSPSMLERGVITSPAKTSHFIDSVLQIYVPNLITNASILKRNSIFRCDKFIQRFRFYQRRVERYNSATGCSDPKQYRKSMHCGVGALPLRFFISFFFFPLC